MNHNATNGVSSDMRNPGSRSAVLRYREIAPGPALQVRRLPRAGNGASRHGWILGLAVLATTARAYAQNPAGSPDPAGSYEVKFEQISSNCEHPITYPPQGSIEIAVKGNELQVDIDRDHTPPMVGKRTKNGKISAKSPRPGSTPYEGMTGVFSVAGRVTVEGLLSLVMIGEYQSKGKPLCTQSWNISGLRARPDKKP